MTQDDGWLSPLYKPEITHRSIDLRARLFRECEAMGAHVGARGITASPETRGALGILDVGIEKRDDIPMSELVALHNALAKDIRPALPRSIEMMHWDARENKFWHRFAPIRDVRSLLVYSIVFWTLFLITVIGGTYAGTLNSENVAKTLFALAEAPVTGPDGVVGPSGVWTVVTMMAFYLSLAGIGATFSILYDAGKYVAEGTFDPRIGSNYPIRVALGLMAGLMLAQILSLSAAEAEKAEFTQLETFGKPLLALLGGFAAQFVYRALNKMVDAAESVFRPDRAVEVAMRTREMRVAEQERAVKERAERIGGTFNLVQDLTGATTTAARTGIAQRLIRETAGDALGGASSTVAGVMGPAHEKIRKAETMLRVGTAILDFLPDDQGKDARGAMAKISDQVSDISRIAAKGASGDVVGMAVGIVEELTEIDPVRKMIGKAVSSFGGPLLGLGGLAGGPAGLALSVVTMAVSMGRREFGRWKTRILDAPYAPDLLEIGMINSASVRAAVEQVPALAAVLADKLGSPAALNNLAREIEQSSDDALFEAYGAKIEGGRAGFDHVMAQFRRALMGEIVARELPEQAVAEARAEDGAALVDALDAIRNDAEARTELERLVLVAAAAGDPNSDVDEAELRAAIQAEVDKAEDK